MRPTFTNPLYPASLPDPYVLKVHGQYWAYGSERSTDGKYFKILHSPDLLHWQEIGGALDEQPGGHPCYWAPEVVEWDSTFYLYYSLGNETLMSIHVASAASPAGPFVDRGRSLTQEPFAIDAHVFTDEDGERYLFYATDFYDHARIGTGTICDRMLDPFTLAGSPHPVSRARYDWQIFDPQRKEKGGVRWHTLEGPFVLKHKGSYYQMFSGGNWQNTTYGVSYATSLSLEDPEEWQQACDGLDTLPILRSLPEKGIVGPGHNSVVRAPDNRQWFCVYHRWAPGWSSLAIGWWCMDRAALPSLLHFPPRVLSLPLLRAMPPGCPYPGGPFPAPGSRSKVPAGARCRCADWFLRSG